MAIRWYCCQNIYVHLFIPPVCKFAVLDTKTIYLDKHLALLCHTWYRLFLPFLVKRYMICFHNHIYGFHSSSLSWSPPSPARAWCWKSPTCRSSPNVTYCVCMIFFFKNGSTHCQCRLPTLTSRPIYCLLGSGLYSLEGYSALSACSEILQATHHDG